MRLHLALSCEVNSIDYNNIGLHGRQVVDPETGTEERAKIICAQVILHIQGIGGLGRQIKIFHVDGTTRKSAGNDGRLHTQAQREGIAETVGRLEIDEASSLRATARWFGIAHADAYSKLLEILGGCCQCAG